MAVIINGSGTVTGISVGGLPDGSVDADTLAANSVTAAKIVDGTIVDAEVTALAASKLTGALPAISAANLTDIAHVATSAPGTPATGKLWYDTTDAGAKLLKIYNGSAWDVVSNALLGTVSNPANTLQDLYNANTPNGIIYMQVTGYNSGAAFPVRYASFASKGWIEILYSKAAYTIGAVVNHPWGEWVPTSGDGGFISHNNSSGGINYASGDSSSIRLNASGFVATDFALTTKSSVTADGVAATGSNQASAYPLTKASILGNSTASAITKVIDYFDGSGTYVHIGSLNATSGAVFNDSDAHFRVAGSTLHFEGLFGGRDGTIPGTEWGIDGNENPGSTHGNNWGYRSASPQNYSGASAGAWHHSEIQKAGYEIDSGNVMSAWITSM